MGCGKWQDLLLPFLKVYFRSLIIKDALKTLVHAVVDIGLTEPSLDNLRCAPSRCFFPKVSMYFFSLFCTSGLLFHNSRTRCSDYSKQRTWAQWVFLLKIYIWQTYVVSLERPVVAQKDKQKSKLGVSCDETEELKENFFSSTF